MAKFTILVICALAGVALAQNTRRYRPFPSVTVLSGNNDGRYVQDNSGRYSNNDGRYVPDNSGQYRPDNSGSYSGESGRYRPDDSGKYTGTSDKYVHQDERYRESVNSASGSGFGSSTGFGAGIRKPVSSVSDIVPVAGFGKPVAVKQGSAAGKYDNRHYAILRQEGDIDQDGYHYLYETENGITGEEQGKLHNRGTDDEAMRAHGFFTYTGPDNVVYTVRYTADENGFVPQGEHLPTPPPIPDAILRSLEYQRQQGTL